MTTVWLRPIKRAASGAIAEEVEEKIVTASTTATSTTEVRDCFFDIRKRYNGLPFDLNVDLVVLRKISRGSFQTAMARRGLRSLVMPSLLVGRHAFFR